MGDKFSMDDYVDVAERIQDFKDAHPDGSLQTVSWQVIDVGGKQYVVYQAAAFRTPEDARPGHGIAWEPHPGRTPYTKDSELMNAETAAWGRAVCALGLVSNRKLASRQEVRARQEDQAAEETAKPAPTKKPAAKAAPSKPAAAPVTKADPVPSAVVDRLRVIFDATDWTPDKLKWKLVELGVENADDLKAAMESLTLEQALLLAEALGGTLDGV